MASLFYKNQLNSKKAFTISQLRVKLKHNTKKEVHTWIKKI